MKGSKISGFLQILERLFWVAKFWLARPAARTMLLLLVY